MPRVNPSLNAAPRLTEVELEALVDSVGELIIGACEDSEAYARSGHDDASMDLMVDLERNVRRALACKLAKG